MVCFVSNAGGLLSRCKHVLESDLEDDDKGESRRENVPEDVGGLVLVLHKVRLAVVLVPGG